MTDIDNMKITTSSVRNDSTMLERFHSMLDSLSDENLDTFERQSIAQELERFMVTEYSFDDNGLQVESPFRDMMKSLGWVLIIPDVDAPRLKGQAPISKGIMRINSCDDPGSVDDYPCVITDDGACVWIVGGRIHRDNGPAVITGDGEVEFWVDGVKQS